jgi:hypothetical protein
MALFPRLKMQTEYNGNKTRVVKSIDISCGLFAVMRGDLPGKRLAF